MTLLAIDPGTTESAWVVWDGQTVGHRGLSGNPALLTFLCSRTSLEFDGCTEMAIEMIASYGMPVGAEVFETCVWIGRFIEAWAAQGRNWRWVYRRQVKLELCGSARAKDGNIRQALIDRFGGKDKAIGKKKAPGPLYGISGDLWAALGVAIVAKPRVAV